MSGFFSCFCSVLPAEEAVLWTGIDVFSLGWVLLWVFLIHMFFKSFSSIVFHYSYSLMHWGPTEPLFLGSTVIKTWKLHMINEGLVYLNLQSLFYWVLKLFIKILEKV